MDNIDNDEKEMKEFPEDDVEDEVQNVKGPNGTWVDSDTIDNELRPYTFLDLSILHDQLGMHVRDGGVLRIGFDKKTFPELPNWVRISVTKEDLHRMRRWIDQTLEQVQYSRPDMFK
jgi:hypothetical protein